VVCNNFIDRFSCELYCVRNIAQHEPKDKVFYSSLITTVMIKAKVVQEIRLQHHSKALCVGNGKCRGNWHRKFGLIVHS